MFVQYVHDHTHTIESSPPVRVNIYKTDSVTCAMALLKVGLATKGSCQIFDGHLPMKTGQREAFDCNGRGSAVCLSFIVTIKCACIYMSLVWLHFGPFILENPNQWGSIWILIPET